MPPPPLPTLFPYTTLFRSRLELGPVRRQGIAEVGHRRREVRRPEAAGDEGRLHDVGVGLDRKSTRLNSSHLVISYAVFCLKKKKNDASTAYRATNAA